MPATIPRVLAVHDLSGLGRISLSVAIPVLSAMGAQVVALPTSLLSASTAFPGHTFLDLTENMRAMLGHWKELGLRFDAIYSGFLGSPLQVDILTQAFDDFAADDTLIMVDPVLGDNGRLYRCFDDGFVRKMRELVAKADIITPNLTEARLLLGLDETARPGGPELKGWLRDLSAMGPDVVVLTSAPGTTAKTTAVLAYERQADRFWRVECSYVPASYPGTGDTFASVLTGALLQGDSLPIALDRAVNFVSLAIRSTFGHQHDPHHGVHIERVLETLRGPVIMSSYELV